MDDYKILCYKNLDFLQDGDEAEFDNASKVINNATIVFWNDDSAIYNASTLCMRGNFSKLTATSTVAIIEDCLLNLIVDLLL